MGIELILIQVALSLCLGDAILVRTRSGGVVEARRACSECGHTLERRELGEPVCRCERG